MADPVIPASSQPFEFTAGKKRLQLTGVTTKWSGKTLRRSATHVAIKRDGQREEDMGRDGRYFEARLSFTGPNCARDYTDFETAVAANPFGLLKHPTNGQWQAFCKGPQHSVDLERAINLIEVTVAWTETELDKKVAADPPDVATAQQNVTGQLAQFQQTVANYMGAVAIAAASLPSQQIAISAMLDVLALASAPIDVAQAVINSTMGQAPAVIAATQAISNAADALSAQVNAFVDSSGDVFNDATTTTSNAGFSGSVASQVDSTTNSTEALLVLLLAASPTPAAAGDAYGVTCELLDACMTLSDAITAARPPVVSFIVPFPCNIIVLSQRIIDDRGLDEDAATYASAVMGLNQIPNPANIPAGTRLSIPTR